MPALQRAAVVAVPAAIRDWGEAFAVAYALDDARTHLVPAAGADLLGWLSATPAGLSRDEIVAAWAAAEGATPADAEPTDAPDAESMAQRVDELIDRLLAAGLLRVAASTRQP